MNVKRAIANWLGTQIDTHKDSPLLNLLRALTDGLNVQLSHAAYWFEEGSLRRSVVYFRMYIDPDPSWNGRYPKQNKNPASSP